MLSPSAGPAGLPGCLRRGPISCIRNGGKGSRGKMFFPLDPFLWLYGSCFLYRQAGHGAPLAGARDRWTKPCAAACPAGGHALAHLGLWAAGQAIQVAYLKRLYQLQPGPGRSPGALSPGFLQRKPGPAGGASQRGRSEKRKPRRILRGCCCQYFFTSFKNCSQASGWSTK